MSKINILSRMLARKYVLASKISGLPSLSNFKIIEEKIPEIKDGEILARAEWLTVDPYMRARSVNGMSIGDEFVGGQIARVVESKCDEFPVGSQVVGYFGWRDLTLYKPDPNGPRIWTTIHKMPNLRNLPPSYALGSLGMPGNTAFFGLTELLKPKIGETLVVSAAAGAVGSLVGQIGKIKGCKVIGFAGSDEKCSWLTNELGFDLAFNYKTVNLDKTFKKYVPQGIDCYFDNVGGVFVYHVIENMNQFGRIAQCGSISTYNKIHDNSSLIMEPFDYKLFRSKNISLLGFNVGRWSDRWFEGIETIRDWIIEGKIKVEETVNNGFETMPQAFIDLLEGKNTGKQIIKVQNIKL